MKRQLILFVPNTIAMVINILCIFGTIDIKIAKWGVIISTLLLGFFNLFMNKKTYEREKSTPKKTIYELIFFCVVIGNFLTFFVALILYYNK